jgi:hypothetical protein
VQVAEDVKFRISGVRKKIKVDFEKVFEEKKGLDLGDPSIGHHVKTWPKKKESYLLRKGLNCNKVFFGIGICAYTPGGAML